MRKYRRLGMKRKPLVILRRCPLTEYMCPDESERQRINRRREKVGLPDVWLLSCKRCKRTRVTMDGYYED